MGLFDFLKSKNRLVSPMAPPSGEGLPSLSDLPPIDGSSLPSLPVMSGSSPTALSSFAPQVVASEKSESLTVQLPPLDFTLPPKDEDVETSTPEDSEQQRSTLQSLETPSNQYVDLSEDINQLFIADKNWHEPDWNNFEPYPEPVIELPKLEDFGMVKGQTQDAEDYNKNIDSDLPLFELEEKKRVVSDALVDVFVRGKDYVRVYAELDSINYLLDNQEPRILTLFEDVLSKEEELLKKSRDTMEYVYKRLIIIDKRIFG
jgi:hypothetical protein